jgi:hypothetical protein
VEHSGGDAGYRSNIIRFPEQHFSVVTLCNTPAPPWRLNLKVADLYLAGDFKAAAPSILNERSSVRLAPEKLAGKEGFYLFEKAGLVTTIAAENGALEQVEGDDKTPLFTDGNGRFQPPDSMVSFHFEPAEGEAQRLVVDSPNNPPEDWKHLPAFALAPGTEGEYAGSYYSDELGVAYHIEDKAGKLVLTRRKYPDQTLTPVIRDLFTADDGALAFARDSSGHVSEMSLTTERVRRLKFIRE